MELFRIQNTSSLLLLLFLLYLRDVQSTLLSDVISRTPRQTKYYQDRYQKPSTTTKISSDTLKPEDSPEARQNGETIVGKRCSRCEYRDTDKTYDYRDSVYDDRSDERSRDRYQDRYLADYDRRYDERDRDRDRYRYYDRSDKERERYYDAYDERDKDRYYDRRYNYDDRPERNDRDRSYYSRDYDRYDRDRQYYDRDKQYYDRNYYDRDYDRDYDRYNDRYDHRDRGGYRPWDETTRGSSGFDKYGRGYYFATGRPEYGGSSGYASGWNYSGGRDDDNYRRWKNQGFDPQKPAPPLAGPDPQPSSAGRDGWYRFRDEPGYHRGTSYLYGRPTTPSTSTEKPSSIKGNSVSTEASNSPTTG